MTEAEWLTANFPRQMLNTYRRDDDPNLHPLLRESEPKAYERKLRLFAVECCRRVWALLPDERSRRSVLAAEAYADGKLSEADNETIREAAYEVYKDKHPPGSGWPNAVTGMLSSGWEAAQAAVQVLVPYTSTFDALRGAMVVGEPVVEAIAFAASEGEDIPKAMKDFLRHAAARVEHETHCDLLRCIFGNPFRPVTFAPSWRSETAVSLASGIYEERAFDRLPILADVLEEAGCDNSDVLNHLRGPSPHARGCWVVDGVLGKE